MLNAFRPCVFVRLLRHGSLHRLIRCVLTGACCLAAAALAEAADSNPVLVISTFAGIPPGSADGTGSAARFWQTEAVAVDAAENIYVADSYNCTVRKITPAGVVTTIAGAAGQQTYVDGPGASARFNYLSQIAVDTSGNLYVGDSGALRKISTAGIVSTLTSNAGAFTGIVVNSSGDIFVTDPNENTVKKISPSGAISVLAGGSQGAADGTGSAAKFHLPGQLAMDSSGNLYVADTLNCAVRKVTPGGVVTTLAGQLDTPGYADGAAASARFYYPHGVTVDLSGNVYVADSGASIIRKITAGGTVSTIAGGFAREGSADATGTAARFSNPVSLAVSATGNIYVGDSANFTVRKISPSFVVTTLAGSPSVGNDDGATARFHYPTGIATDASGNVWVADRSNNAIRKITPAGVVSTYAGNPDGSAGLVDGAAAAARFFWPTAIAVDSAGNVFVSDTGNNVIRKITPGGTVSSFAGKAAQGSADGTGAGAQFFAPAGLGIDAADNLYVADRQNHTIRKITPSGVVTTVAGTAGVLGSADGVGANARFNEPSDVAVDASGNLYVADMRNNLIRKITADGTVSTLAGTAGVTGFADGTGAAATFRYPSGVAISPTGEVYVSDQGNNTIRLISGAGQVRTVAGTAGLGGGSALYSIGHFDGVGDGARFREPWDVAVDSAGNVYVSDFGNNAIRKGVLLARTTPTITWAQPAGITFGTALSSTQLNAVSNVPGTFVYSPAAGVFPPAGTQTLSVVFTPSNPGSYNSATAQVTLTVARTPVSLSWNPPGPIAYGTPLSNAQLNANAMVPGSFVYSPAAGTVLEVGNYTLRATFTPADPANYLPASVEVQTRVYPILATLTWTQPAPIVYGVPLSTAQLNAVANVPGSFTYTPALGTVLHAGEHGLTVVFTPTDSLNYAPAGANFTLSVSKAPLTIKAADKSKVRGADNPAATLEYAGFVNGDGPLNLTFLPTAIVGATKESPVGTYPITLSGGSDEDYSYVLQSGTLEVSTSGTSPSFVSAAATSFTVGKASAFSIAATGTPAPTYRAVGLPTWLSLDSVSGALSGTPTTASGSPWTITITASNGTLPDAVQSLKLTVLKSTPVIQWTNPSATVYGTALGPQQLNAIATLPGSFSYTPAAGTILNAGPNQTLTATFTPSDSTSFATVSLTALLTVNKASLTVTAADISKVEGEKNPELRSIYAGFVKGEDKAVIDVLPQIATDVRTETATGNYPITLSGGTDNNYALTLVNGTFRVSAFTAAPSFTTQPLAVSAGAGTLVTFAAEASGTPTPDFKWQSSADGISWADIADGYPIDGARTPKLRINEVTEGVNGRSYRVLASNTVGSATSAAARLTVLPAAVPSYAGVYFGVLSGDRGRWAMKVNPDKTAVFIAHLNQRNSVVSVALVVSENGTFTVGGTEFVPLGQTGIEPSSTGASRSHSGRTTAGVFTLSGQIGGGSVTGQLGGLGETFAGVADDATAVGSAGYFSAQAATGAGSMYAIVSPSGHVLAVAVTGTGVDSASGLLVNGQMKAATLSGGEMALNLDATAATVAGTFTPAGGAGPVGFGGAQNGGVPQVASRLVNLSVRSRAGKEDKTLIMGFVVSGSGTKQILVRGLGPRLSDFGLSDALVDPGLRLYSQGTEIDSNDNWGGPSSIQEIFAKVGATALLAASKDAALLRAAAAGVYSAHVTSKDESTGIALAEIYDVDKAGARLVNVSARCEARTGDDVLVAGFVLEGAGPKTLLIRGLGPTLAALGVSGALADPQIEVFNQAGAVIGRNDDWAGTSELKAAFDLVGAAALTSGTSKDAALLVTLQAGVYSVQVSGVNGTSGVTLVEVYEMP